MYSCRLFSLLAINIPLCEDTKNYVSILLWMDSQAISNWAIMSSDVINILYIYMFLWTHAYNFAGLISRSGIILYRVCM